MSKIFKFSLSVIFFLISITLIIFFFNLKLKSECYEKCAEFHLLGETTFWEFSDYFVFNETHLTLQSENKKRVLKVGQRLEILLINANHFSRTLEFKIERWINQN